MQESNYVANVVVEAERKFGVIHGIEALSIVHRAYEYLREVTERKQRMRKRFEETGRC